MTFSLGARCAESGQFGITIASSSPTVAARCAYARAATGAVASQNVTGPRPGPRARRLLRLGATATEASAILAPTASHALYRQTVIVDATGTCASHSGSKALGIWAARSASDKTPTVALVWRSCAPPPKNNAMHGSSPAQAPDQVRGAPARQPRAAARQPRAPSNPRFQPRQ